MIFTGSRARAGRDRRFCGEVVNIYNRNALVITDTELKLIAAATIRKPGRAARGRSCAYASQKNHCNCAKYNSGKRAYSLPGAPSKNCAPTVKSRLVLSEKVRPGEKYLLRSARFTIK